jgi:hypothetical protein
MKIDLFTEGPVGEKNYIRKVYKAGETVKIDKQSLVIICDLSKDDYPLTGSGKGVSVASSHGNDPIEQTPMKLSFNLTSRLPS